MLRVYILVVLSGAAACGRLGFEDVADGDRGPGAFEARLSAITLWAEAAVPLNAAIAFSPDVASYMVEVGVSMESVRLSAIPLDPDTAITIEAVPTASGELSTPFALAFGSTTFTVEGIAKNGARASYTIEVKRATELSQELYAKASNAGFEDRFGGSVALSGDTLVVGAPQEDSNATGIDGNQADDSAPDSGAVYVFVRNGGAWSQQAYLKASNAQPGDVFGGDLSLAGDTLVVGAQLAAGTGAAYVFTRSGGVWSQQAILSASNAGAGDRFGRAVAISGETIAIGAYGEASNAVGVGGNQNDNSAPNSGAVYVFTRAANVWSQQAYIKASNTQATDFFGIAISLSNNTLAVTAYNEDSNATGVGGNQGNNSALDAGAAYVFTRTGTVWSQQAYLKASNAEGMDLFGASVSLSGDTLAVGARYEASISPGINGDQTDNTASGIGAVYVFTRAATVWSQQAYVKSSNPQGGDELGLALALSGDTLAVGAFGESSAATGIGGDQTDNSASSSGAVYMFSRTTGTWTQRSYIKASNTAAGDFFGIAVALSGDTLAVGAPNGSSQVGAVYVFH